MQAASTYTQKVSLAHNLAVAILEQALADAVYIYYKCHNAFTENPSENARGLILIQEKSNMVQFINSEDFEILCTIIGQNNDIMKEKMLKVLNEEKSAEQAKNTLNIHLATKMACSIAFCLVYFVVPGFCNPPLPIPTPTPSVSSTVVPAIQLVSLENIHTNQIPVLVNTKLTHYPHTVYTYLDAKGNQVSLPFKVSGVKNNYNPPSKKIKNASAKATVLAPFISVAGSIAQIFTAFHL